MTQFAVVLCAASIMTACNRNTTDQGGTGSDTVSGTARENGVNQPARTEPTPPAPVAPPPTPPAPAVTDNSADAAAQQDAAAKPADNTGKNVRDRSDAAVTPGDQGESKPDLDITQRIRRAVTSNDQLSTDAKNIKIITANGKVTLRGPVKSAAEQQQILDQVKAIQGVTEVDNQLEVKASP